MNTLWLQKEEEHREQEIKQQFPPSFLMSPLPGMKMQMINKRLFGQVHACLKAVSDF